MGGGYLHGKYPSLPCSHYLIIIEVISEADSTTTPDMEQTVFYGSDKEDITSVESTDKESDNIMNNPLQHAIVQQGPSQQAPMHQGPNQ